jgi:multidrug efflux pump subunit AcrA (membrane-fusion protein)
MTRTHRFLSLALLAWLCGCGGGKERAAGDNDAATVVQTAKAVRGPIERTITADAILYPVTQSAITPKISAPVRRFLVNRGDHVTQGQLLAELEDRDLVSAVSESKAQMEQAQAQFLTTTEAQLPEDLTKARADAESARQALDAAKKLYDNRVALVKEGALAQKLADDAKVSLVQAQSQFDTAQRHLEAVRSVSGAQQTRSAQGQLDAAKAHYAGMQAQLGYAEVRSPIDGTVADRPVNAGEMAVAGSPIITVVNVSEIVARANVPASEIGHLKVGQDATITSAAGDLPAKVTVVSPAADPSSTTIEVWVKARNRGAVLKPGVTAKVSMHAETIPDAVIVPAAALLNSDEGESIVMVVAADSTAHEQKVETGVRDGDRVQITEGLKGGEAVVTNGGVGLADKAKVSTGKAETEK